MWRDILKEKISLLEILNEEIQEGYTIYLENLTYKVRADKHEGITFQVAELHHNLNNADLRGYLQDNDEQAERFRQLQGMNPTNLEDSATKEFIHKVKAAIKGLDLFLGDVARNGDLDKISGDYMKTMTLEGDTGLKIKFTLTSNANCNSSMEYEAKYSTMCLSHSIDNSRPAAGDAWLTLYSLFNIIKDDANEQILETLTDEETIPNVIKTAYDAVLHNDYIKRCNHCHNYLDDNEVNTEQCHECGYQLMTDNETTITSEEDEEARAEYPIAGWYCPYDGEFVGYQESCDEHGISPYDEGPGRGYSIQDAFWFDGIQLFKVGDGNTFVTDPTFGDYREFTRNEILENYDLEVILIDFKNYFGDVEDGLDYLGIGPWEEVGDNITFEHDGEKHIFYNNTNTLEPYDERFDEMEGHILSSGIEVEVDRNIPFEDALDEAIEKVEEIIEEAKEEEEEPNHLNDAKKLLLELQSMR